MTTQRDRLAAILTEGMADLDTPQDFGDFAPVCTPREYADALLARGVRVVDVETLGKALDKHECVGDWSICNHKCAQPVLDAIDEATV